LFTNQPVGYANAFRLLLFVDPTGISKAGGAKPID